jgi:cell division protein FtsQ
VAGARPSPAAAGPPGSVVAPRRRDLKATWFPSRRSSIAALATLLAGVALYAGARQTSVFAIDQVEVHGASPGVAARVSEALEPLAGSSLVAFDATDGNRLLTSVPLVAAATYDRDFPHTLKVTVVPEVPIALLRRGRDAWVVSDSARVLRRVADRPLPSLPRIWLPANADPLVGSVLADDSATTVRALSAMREIPLPVPIRSVRLVDRETSITLASGVEIMLGSPSELPLKIAVVARILPLAPDARYLDVSVPERAVATDSIPLNSKVED